MGRNSVKEYGETLVRGAVKDRRVLFITTKNLDYIRNSQEIRLIKESAAQTEVLGFADKSYAVRLLKLYRKLLVLNAAKFEIVFVGFAPQLVLPFWGFKFKKNEIIVDFFISMYDTLVNDRKKFRETSVAARFLKKLDRMTVKKANFLISDTKAHGEYFVKEFGADPEKLHTLYLEADRSIYYPRQVERPQKLRDKFIVLYFGSVLPLQGVDIVLKAYELLKNDDRFYMYMIGKVDNKFDRPSGDNIEYIDWLSQEELAGRIAMADLCLAGHFNKDIDKARRTIPGKAYIYRSMNKKILLGDNPANRELFEASEDIRFVPMGDGKALADAIKKMAE